MAWTAVFWFYPESYRTDMTTFYQFKKENKGLFENAKQGFWFQQTYPTQFACVCPKSRLKSIKKNCIFDGIAYFLVKMLKKKIGHNR